MMADRLRWEVKRENLQDMVVDVPDVEALTARALAHVAKLREVLEQGTIVEKKEFLRGLVAAITLFPSENRGVITFYDLIPASFKCSAGIRDQ